jgi:uncharacterized protein
MTVPAPAGGARFAGIGVVGRGRVKVVPDIATFGIAAAATARSAAEAMNDASSAMRAMTAAAESAGIEAADRQTSGIQLSTWRDHEGGPVRYQARLQLMLRTRDVDTAGEVLQRVLSAGGNRAEVWSSGFTIDDEEPLADQARDAAMADARRRAEQLARLAGRPLGPVLAVQEEGGGRGRSGVSGRYLAMAASAGDEMGGAPVEPGQVVVEVAVLVEYGWGD